MATREFLFAGFGGQGLLFSGKVLACDQPREQCMFSHVFSA